MLGTIQKKQLSALYITILVDAVGSYLTVHKAYVMPESETSTAWILAALSGIFATLAVGSINIVLLSYPVFIVFANLAVVVAIQLGLRRKIKK